MRRTFRGVHASHERESLQPWRDKALMKSSLAECILYVWLQVVRVHFSSVMRKPKFLCAITVYTTTIRTVCGSACGRFSPTIWNRMMKVKTCAGDKPRTSFYKIRCSISLSSTIPKTVSILPGFCQRERDGYSDWCNSRADWRAGWNWRYAHGQTRRLFD